MPTELFCPYCSIGIDYNQMRNRECNNCSHTWEVYHVLPNNDSKEHIESYTCHCLPEVKIEGHNMVIVHNSFDGREHFEPDNKVREN